MNWLSIPPMDNHQEANPPMKPSICAKCKGRQVDGESPNAKLDQDYQEVMHENKLAMREIQKLKQQVVDLKSGYNTLTNGHTKFANMMSLRAINYDKQVLGFPSPKIVEKARNRNNGPSKPKVRYCIEYQQEGHFAFDCNTLTPTKLKDQLRTKAFNAHYGLSRTSKGKVVRLFGAKDPTRPRQLWVPKNLITSLNEPRMAKNTSSSTSSTQTSNKVWVAKH
ncbi:hypothetical protein HU200_029398 [Digitaria exilis]|uniref:Uncharacterized protein n=1 Tax=Digitaria exilis TaxID=1010633 RepID=A0A835BUC4_9POAL|nr:hypothetical protein HU200_029398 [Digitaria exilis]